MKGLKNSYRLPHSPFSLLLFPSHEGPCTRPEALLAFGHPCDTSRPWIEAIGVASGSNQMTQKAKQFLNGWTVKDILILSAIVGGVIHGESKGVDIGKSAEDAVGYGVHHFEAQMATVLEHQNGQDRALSDHETRIRILEHPMRPQAANP